MAREVLVKFPPKIGKDPVTRAFMQLYSLKETTMFCVEKKQQLTARSAQGIDIAPNPN